MKRFVTSSASAQKRSGQAGASWSGLAFIVEALVLLIFLIASLALFMQLIGSSLVRGEQSGELASAATVAANCAERFAADPEAVASTQMVDDLIVNCQITPEEQAAGTLYRANIVVLDAQEGTELYHLDTAHYVSGVDR